MVVLPVAIALILGGALGNLIDRITFRVCSRFYSCLLPKSSLSSF